MDRDTYYYHNDPLGSPILITDASGDVVKRYNYYAFGGIRSETGSLTNTHKFTGKELDESGLYYFGARYMDNAIGRFITPDPASPDYSNPQNLNPYSYCFNNPLKLVDPSGARPMEASEEIAVRIAMQRADMRWPEARRAWAEVAGQNEWYPTLDPPVDIKGIPAKGHSRHGYSLKGLISFLFKGGPGHDIQNTVLRSKDNKIIVYLHTNKPLKVISISSRRQKSGTHIVEYMGEQGTIIEVKMSEEEFREWYKQAEDITEENPDQLAPCLEEEYR